MLQNNLIPSGFVACTPSDTTQCNFVGLMVGGAGTVVVIDGLGVTTTLTCVAGQTVVGQIAIVKAASTATGLAGLVA